jgi:hypothetical protein
MEMQELEITIDREGVATIHVKGVRGPGCESLTKKLEDRIGETRERTYTAEYFEELSEIGIEEHTLGKSA